MRYDRSGAKAYARQHMVGIWGAILYPFAGDGELDEAGLRANVRRYVDGKLLDGIFCGQFMSEFWTLTGEERKRAAEVVLDEAGGAIPVVVHIGHHSARESVQLAQHAQGAGATYLAVGPPYFSGNTDDEIIDYVRYISDRTELGILLVNTYLAGVTVGPDVINRLADLENVVALKNAMPLNHTMETLRLAGDRIVISDPNERDWLMLVVNFGFRLYMSSPIPYLLQMPGRTIIRDYTALAIAGNPGQAAALSYELEPARNVWDKWIGQWTGQWKAQSGSGRRNAIAHIKAWSELMGMAGGSLRPALQITEAARREMRSDLEGVGILEPNAEAKSSVLKLGREPAVV